MENWRDQSGHVSGSLLYSPLLLSPSASVSLHVPIPPPAPASLPSLLLPLPLPPPFSSSLPISLFLHPPGLARLRAIRCHRTAATASPPQGPEERELGCRDGGLCLGGPPLGSLPPRNLPWPGLSLPPVFCLGDSGLPSQGDHNDPAMPRAITVFPGGATPPFPTPKCLCSVFIP